jgi:hypothetical protein
MRNRKSMRAIAQRCLVEMHEQLEPLYDVFNECGEMLMRGVAHAAAVEAIEANQGGCSVVAQWQGDICIRLQRSGRNVGTKGGVQ